MKVIPELLDVTNRRRFLNMSLGACAITPFFTPSFNGC